MDVKKHFGAISILFLMNGFLCEYVRLNCTEPRIYGKCHCMDEEDNVVRVVCKDIDVEEIGKMFERANEHGKIFNHFKHIDDRIQVLPSGYFKGVQVEKVTLEMAMLDELKPEVFETVATHISILHIKKSNIPTVPFDVMNALPNLKDFAFEKGSIRGMKDNFFKDVENKERFKRLSFANNRMTFIRQGAMSSFSALTSVSLRGNELSSVPTDAFPSTRLDSLNLDDNLFIFFPHTLLELIKDDGWLYLKSNKISKFLDESQGKLEKIKFYIRLDGNPIRCDCSLSSFIKEIKGNRKIFGKCGHPSKIRDKKLYELDDNDFSSC